MISLKEWMELVSHRITEGSQYCDVYGYDAYCLTSWDGRHDGYSFSIIFNCLTQKVYEVQAHDYSTNRAYRLVTPEYVEQVKDDNNAWDDVDYVILETDEDFIQKSRAIIAGENYDTRVMVNVEFSDEELFKYMKLAHELDITFNQLVERAVKGAMKEHNLSPEDAAEKSKEWLEKYDPT